MPGPDKKEDFRFFDLNGEKFTNIRFLPPIVSEEQSVFPLRISSAPPAFDGTVELSCIRADWSKFGFGCPFCELYLNQYPEDRNEGGIE